MCRDRGVLAGGRPARTVHLAPAERLVPDAHLRRVLGHVSPLPDVGRLGVGWVGEDWCPRLALVSVVVV